MSYFGSDEWYGDVDSARKEWHVQQEDWGSESGVRVVEAASDTGSRYVVIAAPLGGVGRAVCGGAFMVTVLEPWQDAWALQGTGTLHTRYVAEHLTDGRVVGGRLHGGDLMSVAMTIGYALNREVIVD